MLLGGVLTSALGWRSVLFVNVPIGIGAILLTPWLISESRGELARRSFARTASKTARAHGGHDHGVTGLTTRTPARRQEVGARWRIARRYDSSVVRQVSEADVGANVVLVFKVIGRGKTALVFALTRGDTSSKAVKSSTHKILSS